jgi:catechol 2,3-dioxygenase-like lactoylglutathione lyase family enzyme
MKQATTAAVRRSQVTAIHSIDRFAISVPELDAARRFFTAFGLDVREVAGGLELRTFASGHCWANVHESGRAKRLEYLSFGVYPEDLEPLARRARELGVTITDPHPLSDGQGVWMRDPDGIAVRLVAADKVTPSAPALIEPPPAVVNAVGAAIAPSRSKGEPVRPQRLSHVLLFCTDVSRSLRFYSEVLGLRLSDRSGELIAFTHGAHSSDHHLLAFVKSEAPGLHHSSWIVGSVDEIGLGMEQMLAAGFAQGWGVGRHVVGSNYFYYARDPWGSFAEFSCGIDYIDASTEWPAGDYPPEDSFYLWGPQVPEYFTVNHEA